MAKILVVDDEPNIREVVGLYLQREGYTVVAASDGEEALELYQEDRPDLVVLDLALPKLSGLEVCRHIQAERRVPLIMLTAKGGDENRRLGLSMGADDYVVKPFRPHALVARVAELLRESEDGVNRADGRVLVFDGLRIDPNTREVQIRGTPATLPAREFDLLYHLASRSGQVFTRDELMEAVWEHEFGVESSTVTATIHRLREKLEVDLKQPCYLQTVWGAGYRFDVE